MFIVNRHPAMRDQPDDASGFNGWAGKVAGGVVVLALAACSADGSDAGFGGVQSVGSGELQDALSLPAQVAAVPASLASAVALEAPSPQIATEFGAPADGPEVLSGQVFVYL
jgi:hypothetical protein